MIEVILREYLEEALDVPVCLEQPPKPPKKYVLIEKTGSSKVNHITSATMALQSYAPTLYETAVLNEAVKAAVEAAIELPEISSVQLNSDYNYTDTATKRYRYQAVFDFVYY
jgi:hypothetical protein